EPRRSYTQLEYDIAVELGKPIYVFLIDDGYPTAPHEPEAAELRELQEAHRRRLISTDRRYESIASAEQLDQRLRSLQLKVEQVTEGLGHAVDRVRVTDSRLRRWLPALAVLVVATLGAVGYIGWKQERERLAAEAAREEARKRAETAKQVRLEFAEQLL